MGDEVKTTITLVEIANKSLGKNKNGQAVSGQNAQSVLQDYLKAGLVDLYCEVFGGWPYNEVFEREAVAQGFQNVLQAQGMIVLALYSERPVGFMVAEPIGERFKEIAAFNDLDRQKTAYIAEDGVSAAFRRQGISSTMKSCVLNGLRAWGMQQTILRTSIINEPQIQACLKTGAQRLNDVEQMVERETSSGLVQEKNCFFRFVL